MYNDNSWRSSPVSSGSQMPANNPFLESSASNRFPALESSPSLQSSSSFGSQTYPPSSPSSSSSQFQQQSPYSLYPNQQQYTQWNGQPQQQMYNQGGFTGYGPPQQPMQSPTFGSYGQQYGQQYNQQSMYNGQLQSQSQPQLQSQYTGFPQYQQSSVSSQQYQQNIIGQFDPYSGIGGSTSNQNQGGGESPRKGPTGQPHPRDFIRSYKTQLESWDSVAWRQALSTFDELKRAWERRRIELQKHLVSGQYLTADDIASFNSMIKSSEANIDTVTASLIQMQEVHTGYKQSLDSSSRQRVREALNAGLQHLPEWP